jgi:hypothetical protein
MKLSLKQVLYDNFDFTITKKQYLDIRRYVSEFEMRPTHMIALNTAMLGISKMFFVAKDVNKLFNIFDVELRHFKKTVHTADSIDTSRSVTSDPYNIFVMWLSHKIRLSNLSIKEKEDMQFLIFKMLHYKFFTSVVNHNLKYGADEEVMFYTIDELSGKFYIKQKETPTWRLVIEARSRDVISHGSIHSSALSTLHPDEKVLYVITDIQTRIRKQLVTIIYKFHDNKKAGNRISATGMSNEIDGKTVLKVVTTNIDSMVNKISNTVLNTNEFIDADMINVAATLTKNITPDMLSTLLIKFSDLATTQQKKKDQELKKGANNKTILIGYKLLIRNIIQKTYRQCMLDKDIDMGSRVQILNKARNIYRSSRISDKDIIIVKNSVGHVVDEFNISRRESTNSSLKIGFIIYIILLSFKEM